MALLQTVGILIAVLVLSLLVSRVADLWLVQSLLWYIAVGALVRLAWKVLEWWHELLVVTDKRFMLTTGVIQTKNSMMPITKVTDMFYATLFRADTRIRHPESRVSWTKARSGKNRLYTHAGRSVPGDL